MAVREVIDMVYFQAPRITSLLVGPLHGSAPHSWDLNRFETPTSHSIPCSQRTLKDMGKVSQSLLSDKQQTTSAAGSQYGHREKKDGNEITRPLTMALLG